MKAPRRPPAQKLALILFNKYLDDIVQKKKIDVNKPNYIKNLLAKYNITLESSPKDADYIFKVYFNFKTLIDRLDNKLTDFSDMLYGEYNIIKAEVNQINKEALEQEKKANFLPLITYAIFGASQEDRAIRKNKPLAVTKLIFTMRDQIVELHAYNEVLAILAKNEVQMTEKEFYKIINKA